MSDLELSIKEQIRNLRIQSNYDNNVIQINLLKMKMEHNNIGGYKYDFYEFCKINLFR
jgi:hypothetical protein